MNFDFITLFLKNSLNLYGGHSTQVVPYSGSRKKCLQAWAFAAFNNIVNFTMATTWFDFITAIFYWTRRVLENVGLAAKKIKVPSNSGFN